MLTTRLCALAVRPWLSLLSARLSDPPPPQLRFHPRLSAACELDRTPISPRRAQTTSRATLVPSHAFPHSPTSRPHHHLSPRHLDLVPLRDLVWRLLSSHMSVLEGLKGYRVVERSGGRREVEWGEKRPLKFRLVTTAPSGYCATCSAFPNGGSKDVLIDARLSVSLRATTKGGAV